MGEVEPEVPLLTFNLKEGKADLILDGRMQDIWIPLMFAHEEIRQWEVMEPGEKRNMLMVEVNEKIKYMEREQLFTRMKQDYNYMQYKQHLKESCGDKELLVGAYVQIREYNLINWTLAATGISKRRKAMVPKQWADIGFHAGANTQILFDVKPDDIRFKPNSCVSKWLSFDEMQLYCTKEVTPDHKSRLKFRYRIKPSKKKEMYKLYIEMIIMPKQLVYESLPNEKKETIESGAGLTLPFWSLSSPVVWEGEDELCNLTLTPMFGIFNSQIILNDAILRRIVHDITRQAEAGASTSKIGEFYKFLEEPSQGKTFKERSLELPPDPEKRCNVLE